MGQANNDVIVISSFDEIDRIDYSRPTMLYSQTTQSLEKYFQLIELIRKRYEATGHSELFEFADTICRKVANRAKEIADFAQKHDTILLYPEKKFQRTLSFRHLQKNNPNSYMISNAEQIRTLDICSAQNIGICGATSTPMWLMEECAEKAAERCL